MRISRWATCFALGLGLTGCSTTEVVKSHSALAKVDDAAAAKVYFLRPNLGDAAAQRQAFMIFANGRALLQLYEKEYTLLYLKPGATVIAVGMAPRMMSEADRHPSGTFKYESGRTYHVGFRGTPDPSTASGVQVVPILLDQEEARGAAIELQPVGLAKSEPVEGAWAAGLQSTGGCFKMFAQMERHSCLNRIWEVPLLIVGFPIYILAIVIGGAAEEVSKGK